MSYCRWSSDNWKSDVFCYEDTHGGWTTHVAGSRRVGHITPLNMTNVRTMEASYRQQMVDLDQTELIPIGLPHDGESFNDSDLELFRKRLLHLRSIG